MDTSQLLTYGLLVGGFLLFNFLLQRAVQRARERQALEQAKEQEAELRADDSPIDAGWGRQPPEGLRRAAPSEPTARRVETRAAESVSLPRRRAQNLFRSRRDLRHAIVVMTVLGPCRALEPHDRR
jgi:hypothetical protein